jgi:hypothetical protein
MLGCVDLGRTDVSEELSASIIRVTRIVEVGATLAITSNRSTYYYYYYYYCIFLNVLLLLLLFAEMEQALVVPSTCYLM